MIIRRDDRYPSTARPGDPIEPGHLMETHLMEATEDAFVVGDRRITYAMWVAEARRLEQKGWSKSTAGELAWTRLVRGEGDER
jgi:hypothetical protein